MGINSPQFPKPEGLFDRLIQFSIRNAIWVMLFVMTWIAVGIWSYQKLPIDAVPDITNTQVQINTQANGYTALEVEQRITYPIETAMAGIPDLEQTRSISRYGLSQVTIIFKDGTDIYWARQLINQRLQEADGLWLGWASYAPINLNGLTTYRYHYIKLNATGDLDVGTYGANAYQEFNLGLSST